MALKAPGVYQGNDWLTYRWSVAQVFDTLDRIRDLSRHMPAAHGATSAGADMPRYTLSEQNAADLFGCVVELSDDLSGELDAVLADLFPQMQNDAMQRWLGFEIQLHLQAMRDQALHEYSSPEPSDSAVDVIVSLAARMRDLLKQIDQ